MAVYIENLSGTHFNFHYRVTAARCVETVMKDKNIPENLDVNIVIVSAEQIRDINRENRGKDQVTDVLSFPYFEYEQAGKFDSEQMLPEQEEILGDIILCGDKVISQAEEFGHSQKRELAFLVVHSMLHLTGYDHMEQEDAEVMEEEQRRLMKILNIPR